MDGKARPVPIDEQRRFIMIKGSALSTKIRASEYVGGKHTHTHKTWSNQKENNPISDPNYPYARNTQIEIGYF